MRKRIRNRHVKMMSRLLWLSIITFEQVWKAAGFSSNMDDYFDVEDANFVGFGASIVDCSEDIYIYEDTNAESEEMEVESFEFIPAEIKH